MVKGYMVCLGFEPGTAEWKARTNPLSYVPPAHSFFLFSFRKCIFLLNKIRQK